VSYLAVFYVVLNYIDTERKIRRLITAIIICGFLYSMYGIIMQGLSKSTSAFSTLTNRNHFAAYLEMVIFLCLAYSLTKMPKINRLIFIFMASVIALAIFLSASRAGRICFCLSLFIFSLLLVIKKPIRKTVSVIFIVFLFFSFFVVAIGLGQIMQRMDTLLSPLAAYSYRYSMLKDSLQIIKDFPYLGTGFGTFAEIAQKYKTSQWQVSYGFSHNEPVQLIIETGVIGFLFIFLFLFQYLKHIYFVWRKRNSSFPVYAVLGCFVGILSIILHSFFDFVFHIPANNILFFIILALVFRVAYIKEPQSQLPLPKSEISLSILSKSAIVIISCLFFVFLESLVYKRYQAESLFNRIKESKVPLSEVEAIFESRKILKGIDRAIFLNPLNSAYYNKRGDLLAEVALREDMKDKLANIREDFYSAQEVLALAEKTYKKAIDLNPTNPEYHLRLGWLYSIKGEHNLTQDEFKKALSLDPQNMKIKSYIEKSIQSKE
jgi:O-antigen ligase